jgi:RNA polymerase sigma factor (sigma-70 family)
VSPARLSPDPAPLGPIVICLEPLPKDDRDRFIVLHMPMAARLARRVTRDPQQWADLFQEACLALVEVAHELAIAEFLPPAHHAEALALICMRHRIAEAQPRVAWGGHSLSRHGARDWVHLRRILRQMRRDLGREPSLIELAAVARLSPAHIQELLAAALPPAPLDFATTSVAADDPATDLEAQEDHARLREAIAALPEPERAVIRAQFGIGVPQRSMRDLAATMNVSTRRIFDLRQRGLALLRNALRDEA